MSSLGLGFDTSRKNKLCQHNEAEERHESGGGKVREKVLRPEIMHEQTLLPPLILQIKVPLSSQRYPLIYILVATLNHH